MSAAHVVALCLLAAILCWLIGTVLFDGDDPEANKEIALLHVFHNEEEWVIAEDEADAWAVWEEHTGEERKAHDEIEWTQWADDRPLTLLVDSPSDTWQTKTCAEWVAANGRGYLASVDY